MIDLRTAAQGERIIWEGKPDKKCFILECIFNPLLLLALVWGGIDLTIVVPTLGITKLTGSALVSMFPILLFLVFHMMPVWIYLGGVIFSFKRYKNTNYLVTDRRVYISSGIFSSKIVIKQYSDIAHITINQGMIDRKLNVGDVIMDCEHNFAYNYSGRSSHNHNNHMFTISDVAEYEYLFRTIQNLVDTAKMGTNNNNNGYGNNGYGYGNNNGYGYGNNNSYDNNDKYGYGNDENRY